jgi:hypothetical protein
LGKAYKVLVKSIEPIVVVNEAKEFKNYDLEEAEMVVLFSLNALIDIGLFREKNQAFDFY